MVPLGPDTAGVLRSGAKALGVELSEAQTRSLGEFLELVRLWNRRFRLVGTRDTKAQINKHILDSLVPAAVLQSACTLVDIGTGAGLPGVPLAIICSHLSVTLVECRRVRANFVREVVRRLELSNVSVAEGRIESLMEDPASLGPFDATITRAWAGLPKFLEVSAGLLRPGGIAVSMKGPKGRRELAGLRGLGLELSPSEELDYRLPGGGEQRTLLVFKRH